MRWLASSFYFFVQLYSAKVKIKWACKCVGVTCIIVSNNTSPNNKAKIKSIVATIYKIVFMVTFFKSRLQINALVNAERVAAIISG